MACDATALGAGHALNAVIRDDREVDDIRDERALRLIFDERQPEVVFHAAALKHLPMVKQNCHEATQTTVLGTANVLSAAPDVGATTFSTSPPTKAADPKGVLGFSRRVAVRITASMAQEVDVDYMQHPLWARPGQPRLGASHVHRVDRSGRTGHRRAPEGHALPHDGGGGMQLVIPAGAVGEDGEVMILDVGELVRVVDVARQLIELSGKDIEFVYIGLREGEKLREELFGGAGRDERGKHPLVSHAPVLPLSPDVVRAYDLTSTHRGMLVTFEDWVPLPDPGVVTVGARHAEIVSETS